MDERGSFVLDEDRAHPARVYNCLLDGKDNFAADREAVAELAQAFPDVSRMARANRDFLHRAVAYLVGRGARQFLDIGSGIPTPPNLHEVAQSIDPGVRVVYVDNDPVVGAHCRALHSSTPAGRVAVIEADAATPAAILADPVLVETLDLAEPVALMLVSVLMYFDDDIVRDIVDTLAGALPSGSYLAISHPTADFAPDAVAAAVEVARGQGLTYIPRTFAEVEKLCDGWEMCSPGVVAMPAWHPRRPQLGDGNPYALAASTHYWVGVARKP